MVVNDYDCFKQKIEEIKQHFLILDKDGNNLVKSYLQ